MPLKVRPGSDGALACAVMHALFRDGLADRAYMARYADDPQALEAHLPDAPRPPGPPRSPASQRRRNEAFAALVGRNKRTFFRLGYGFSRQRNGAAQHACGAVHPGGNGRLGA